MQETWVPSLGWEDPLQKGKVTYSSILAQRIPWTVQFMGQQRVRHTTERLSLSFPFRWGFPGGTIGKESACQCRRLKRFLGGFDSWVGKIPWRSKWPPTPVFLPEKFHGRWSLACHSPWDCKDSDIAHTHIFSSQQQLMKFCFSFLITLHSELTAFQF